MTRFAVIGPTHPFRGGIAHHTTLLVEQLRQHHEVLFVSFSRQYPAWLFPGKSDRDPSERPLQTPAHYLLDPINPFTWLRTLNHIHRWQPEVVILPWWHPYFAPAWGFLGQFLPQKANLVFICHNVLPHEQGKFGRFLFPLLLRWAIGAGDGYILHSQADAAILQHHLPKARCRVTPLPTYASLGDTASTTLPVSLPEDRPLLLFAGLVRPYKGLDVLLDALPMVKRPFHLLVAGEFWQGSQSYQEQINHLGMQTHVTLWDAYLPNETLAACVNRANVLVLPYRSATQSAVVQLAFGQHKPVITTNVGGLGEVVENGRTGLVVPPADPAALAAAINRYFDESLQGPFTVNIQQNQQQFSWESYITQLLALVG